MSSPSKKRGPLRPRATSAVAIRPLTATDRTAAAIFGLDPRPFRDFVTRESIPHVRLGRRIVVKVDDFLAALDDVARAQAAAGSSVVEHDRGDDGDEPRSVDDVLGRLGKVRTA